MSPHKENNTAVEDEDVLLNEALFTKRRIRLVCIGAGVAGICCVYKYKRQSENVELQIYEKNDDIGGTWYENAYPGVACDIPAHRYTFSWEGNPEWTRFYADGSEIHTFYKKLADKYGCMEYIKLGHQVVSTVWDEEESVWHIKIKVMETGEIIEDYAHVVLCATGVLNKWKWPEIPNLHGFKGRLLHSARWDKSYKPHEKERVAVIGSGSSGIQIVPKIAPLVGEFYSFNRSPTWITPEIGGRMAEAGRETIFTPEQIETFKTDPEAFLTYRKFMINGNTDFFPTFFKESPQQKEAFKNITEMMRKRLGYNEELCKKLIPTFPVGCKRFTPGEGYLEALAGLPIAPGAKHTKPATVITEKIECFTPNGIKTVDGRHYELDTIICATGFDVSYQPSYECIGRNGTDLRKAWELEPRSYLSLMAENIPNYFISLGPNAPIANGSLVYCIEVVIDYTFKCIEKMQNHRVKSMRPKRELIDDWQEYKDAAMEKLVWSSQSCTSWYKAKNGKVRATHFGSVWHYAQIIKEPRYEDFDMEYLDRNKLRFLANGRTQTETRGGDLATHLTEDSRLS